MSKFFIRRPIVAIVIAILTVIIGVVSLLTLPTSQYPNIVPPEILVTATYPGADAKTVSQAVSTPLEQQMNGVDNMIYMNSVSANNGVDSLLTLPTSQYPNIVPPEILVTATYPGADAKTVSQAVSTPLEQQMNGVDNMIYMNSVSANNGVVQLFVDFDVKTDPNIDQVLGQLRV